MQMLPEKILFFAIIFCSVCKVAVNLQLEGLSTKKPRITKYTTKSSQKVTPSPATTSLYRVNATNGATCILIRTDGLLSIQYRDRLGEDKEADVFLPDNVDLKGECYEDESSITMGFKGFVLTMNFKKTPGGERWYINNVDLAYSSSNHVFEHVDRPNLNVKLSTEQHNTLLFPTPVGKSYICDQDRVITMFAQNKDDQSGHVAKLYLRDLRMQSFMYKKASTWGPPFQCSATGTYRDETAPIAVGSTLAIVVLCIITGYGLWRYFKVKKVQYGTME